MLPIEDVRKVDLWEKVSPDEMWSRYKQGLDQMVDRLFASTRARAFVNVKDVQPSISLGDRT